MNKGSNFGITIVDEKLLTDVPSGSGAAIFNDSLIIVGDDATSIYTVDIHGSYEYSQSRIGNYDTLINRIAKDSKPDYEAVTIGTMKGQQYLFAFGSGSRTPQRDSLLVISLHNKDYQKVYPLGAFYEYLRHKTNNSSEQWNVEAATISGDSLLLFNRGDNSIMNIGWSDFTEFLESGELPSISSFQVNLPSQGKHLARISGACTLNNNDILFCASIEDTPDWYQDGEVLGSYIGILDAHTRSIKHIEALKTKDGQMYKIKLESLEVIKQDQHKIDVVAIADNDNGSTLLLRLTIDY